MKRIHIRRIVVLVLMIAVMITVATLFVGGRSNVGADQGREKRFASIQVEKGDSLWSIAQEHITDEYDSVSDYIEEVCESNHIYDDKITEGMYLVVPYYESI